jgi:hypothetical protein
MVQMLWSLGLYRLFPSRPRLERLLRPLTGDEPLPTELIEIAEAVFRNTYIEPEMPRNVGREELSGFGAPVLVVVAERDGLFPADRVVWRSREVFANLVAAETLPGATHYLPPRYHPYLNERCLRFLSEAT